MTSLITCFVYDGKTWQDDLLDFWILVHTQENQSWTKWTFGDGWIPLRDSSLKRLHQQHRFSGSERVKRTYNLCQFSWKKWINRELVPGSWVLVRERALMTEFSAVGCYSEHSGVCRRVSVKVKKVWKVDGVWLEMILKQNKDNVYILFSVGSQWKDDV